MSTVLHWYITAILILQCPLCFTDISLPSLFSRVHCASLTYHCHPYSAVSTVLHWYITAIPIQQCPLCFTDKSLPSLFSCVHCASLPSLFSSVHCASLPSLFSSIHCASLAYHCHPNQLKWYLNPQSTVVIIRTTCFHIQNLILPTWHMYVHCKIFR